MKIWSAWTFSVQARIGPGLVTSKVRGVTRPSEWVKGWRVPAYTRFAPLFKASSTNARPMPRFAPVIKIVLFSMFITFSFRIIVLSIGYYASVGGEDTSQAKDFGIGGVTSWLDGGVDSFAPGPRPEVIHSQFLVCRPYAQNSIH